jgi:hypothetical protein
VRHILHIRTEASLSAIQAAISHTRAKRIALVFPLGQQLAVSSHDLVNALVARGRTNGTDIAIIGGDERLRAAAVAAGFAVATSLDEWETASRPAIRAPRAGLRPVDDEWREPQLTLVGEEETAPADEAWDDEPPDYVIELMEAGGLYPGPRLSESLAPPQHPGGEDDQAALRDAAERYEASMTDTIRDTGGLPPSSQPSLPSLPSLPSASRKPTTDGGASDPESI